MSDESAQEESNARLRMFESVVVHARDAVLITAADTIERPGPRILYVNDAFVKMTGYDADEVIGQSPRILQGTLSDPDTLQSIRRSLERFEPIVAEIVNYRKDKSSFWVELSIVPVFDESGFAQYWVSIQRDITHRKQMDDALRKSDRLALVGELAASFAHEIRNPLTTIKGFMQLVQPNLQLTEGYYRIIMSELKRVELTINELLMLSHPHPALQETKSPRALIDRVVSLMTPKALISNVEISVECSQDCQWLYCDEENLKQVFMNIIKNAIESMPDGGVVKVQVTSSADDRWVVFRVIDHGKGIEPERIPSLGEPSYLTKEKGTGLGLLVSYRIVEAHGGFIHVDSEVSRGTTVTISLPAHHVNSN